MLPACVPRFYLVLIRSKSNTAVLAGCVSPLLGGFYPRRSMSKHKDSGNAPELLIPHVSALKQGQPIGAHSEVRNVHLTKRSDMWSVSQRFFLSPGSVTAGSLSTAAATHMYRDRSRLPGHQRLGMCPPCCVVSFATRTNPSILPATKPHDQTTTYIQCLSLAECRGKGGPRG